MQRQGDASAAPKLRIVARSDANERRLRARIGGLALAAQRDPREYTQKARETFLAKFEREADPEMQLAPTERARRAEALRKLHFTRMALKSAKTRSRRRAAE